MPLILSTAILMWKRGDLVPVDVTTELLALGYDVQALEALHSI